MYQKEIIVQDSLWQSFVNGSREAYARLYELYVRPMYLYGLHFCDDRQIIEDAIHDIFVRIYVNRERLPELKNVKLYLLISLKNTLLNHANSKSFRFRMDISTCRQLHDQTDLEETIVRKEENRPQPVFDAMAGRPERARGMAVTVGRLRQSNGYYKAFAMSHNTLRGGAGGSVLNAELAKAKGIL